MVVWGRPSGRLGTGVTPSLRSPRRWSKSDMMVVVGGLRDQAHDFRVLVQSLFFILIYQMKKWKVGALRSAW